MKLIYLLKILISLKTLFASITSSNALWILLIATIYPLFLSLAENTWPYAPLPTHFLTSYLSSTVIRPSLHSNYPLPFIFEVIYLTILGSAPFDIYLAFCSNLAASSPYFLICSSFFNYSAFWSSFESESSSFSIGLFWLYCWAYN